MELYGGPIWATQSESVAARAYAGSAHNPVSRLWKGNRMSASTTTFAERPLTKRCSRCGRMLPLAEFRRRSKGSDKPHADCRECHRMEQRRRRAERAGRVFRRLTADVHRYRGSSIDRIALFIGAAIDTFGGLPRFVRAFKRSFNRAMKKGQLNVAFRHVNMVTELMLVIERERNRIEQETIDRATTEEIRDDVRTEFLAMLVDLGETDADAREMVERIVGRVSTRA